jgi:CheY-like chemotaxis protein
MEKVLIVDDDEQLLLILEEILGKYKKKFITVAVKNGFEAIQALQQQKFALVVTDLYMPRINGLVLLSYMSKNFPHIPCIIMTGMGTPEMQDRLEKKTTAYIQKPFAVTELADLILATLGQEQNLLGTMDGVSVPGFLKLVESESMTCLCEIQSEDGETGYLVFQGGTLHNAFFDNLRGTEAAVELFKMDRVKIKFRKPPRKKFPKRITKSIQNLLKEADGA